MLKKLLVSVLVLNLLFSNVIPASVVYAAPDLPSSPDTPDVPDTPDEPDTPDKPDNAEPEEIDEPEAQENSQPDSPDTPETTTEEVDEEPNLVVEQSATDGQVGDTKVETGDVNGSGSIANLGNENLSTQPIADTGSGGVSIINDNNGANSDNTGSVAIEESNTTNQSNVGDLNNSLVIDVVSGQNSTSENVGESTIKTGDANTTGSILNSINTNMSGVMLSEFNVDDDHRGDIILDFVGNCIAGCGTSTVINEGNGTNSENSGEIDYIESNATFQENTADVENTLTLSADSGNNNANDNTKGDSTITTGDANVAGNVVNFLNNNIAGNVIYGVVNIFGDLVGDIIIPDEVLNSLGLANTGNGAGSTNSAEVDQTIVDDFTQVNTADIVNNLDLAATTGNNKTSDNTGGNNSITTGDADVDAQVINIANNNIIGGNWWLVLVNEAGKWVGKIFAPDGSVLANNFAVAPGSEVSTAPNGDITVGNTNNGSNSDNSGSVQTSETNTLNQANNAQIVNNINLNANTGANSASRNTGGDNKIETGDANVLVNLVNFVNNNIIGGKVLVTVVNVFGSWMGDIVAPGAEKPVVASASSNDTNQEPARGGSNNLTSDNSTSSQTQSTSNLVAGAVNYTPKKVKLAAAAFDGGVVLGSADTSDTESVQVAIAGQNGASGKVEALGERTVKINLAWLAPIAILGLIIVLIRRKVLGSIQ